MLIFSILCICSYLIGSIPSGLIIGKFFKHIDIREYGSHNIGTTNAYRILGFPLGTLVLFCDVTKGFIGASLPVLFNSYPHYFMIICGFFAVLGHTFSIFLKFKGGKAVATGAGILLAYEPLLFLACVLVFLFSIFITSMVSISSIVGFMFVTFVALFILKDFALGSVAFILMLVVIYRHLTNFQRIKKRQENLVPFGLIYWYYKDK